MKSLLIVTTFFILNCKLYSQRLQENTTYADSYINKFVGTWVWTTGNDTAKLQLIKKRLKITDFNNSYWDWLIGCHSYIKNGILIESSIDQYDSLQYYSNIHKVGSLKLFRIQDDDTSYVGGGLRDITTRKGVHIDLFYLGGTPAKINMKLSYRQGSNASFPDKPYISGITLPQDIILTKQ